MNAGGKIRGQQAKPTKADLSAAWVRLREAAERGSVEANALLIVLAENRSITLGDQGLVGKGSSV